MSGDTLSEVLRAVRLRGAVFFNVHATAPWVADAPPAGELGPIGMGPAQHYMEFHVLIAGRCFGNVVGAPPVELVAGDVIIFPQGDAHYLVSRPGVRANTFATPPQIAGVRLPIPQRDGGGGEATEFVCGFLACDSEPFNPLLAALPRMVHVRGGGGMIDHFTRMAVAESSAREVGSDCVLARLAELMFVDVVRRYLGTLAAEQTGWLAGLRDEHVGRALAALHAAPARAWTLDALAAAAGLSRSSFAERFGALLQTTPMKYLTQWRLQVAAGLLISSSRSVAEVAQAIGYESEAAFSRAFKKAVGAAPAAWRAAQRTTAS